MIIDTTQKASPENAAVRYVENKLLCFSSGLWYGGCSSPDEEPCCPATSLAEGGHVDTALQIDREGQDRVGFFDQGL